MPLKSSRWYTRRQLKQRETVNPFCMDFHSCVIRCMDLMDLWHPAPNKDLTFLPRAAWRDVLIQTPPLKPDFWTWPCPGDRWLPTPLFSQDCVLEQSGSCSPPPTPQDQHSRCVYRMRSTLPCTLLGGGGAEEGVVLCVLCVHVHDSPGL